MKTTKKSKKPLINNKLEAGKNYDFLTVAAEKIVSEAIEKMFEKLATLKNVEFFEDEEDGISASPLNSDTAFREQFYNAIEEEISINFRKY